MKYHQLKTKPTRAAKRVGRGIAAGQGKTAGRGTKGQRSRAGSSAKPGFAGGQTPLMRKLPKLPGFKSHRIPAQTVYTGQLEQLKSTTIDAKILADANLISDPYSNVKLLVKGELNKKLSVNLPAASQAAIESIQKAGGSFEKTARLGRPKTTKTQNQKQNK